LVNLVVRGGVDVLNLIFPTSIVLLKVDLVSQGLRSLCELAGEFLEDDTEIMLLIVLADAPVIG
jgi:hypothetical protein